MSVPNHSVDHPEYNATVTAIRRVHDDLMILRVKPDTVMPPYLPGQYTTLGLLTDERRIDEAEHPEDSRHKLVLRVYSISSPIIDESGAVVDAGKCSFLEFYIALVRKDSDSPPSLTPRIFAMDSGHRIFIGMRPKGTYTLEDVAQDDDVILVATGTGEAPHNAMIAELLASGHTGRIASFNCVRHKHDLAYADQHRALERQFPNYRYVTMTTREPENIDPNHPQFIGKQYLQDAFRPDELQRHLGWLPVPGNAHVFLCGNPAMIGAPKRDADGTVMFPDPKGMIETLTELGFRLDQPHTPGNIHFERYW